MNIRICILLTCLCWGTVAMAVEKVEFREDGLVVNLHHPGGLAPRPVVVVFGGSAGGIEWADYWAAMLAKNDIAGLALAYFKMDGLPPNLELIPLEYVEKAFAWLRDRSDIAYDKLAVMGASKGGELALLLGSRFPDIKAVIAYVPANVAFQSIAPGFPRTSSWSYQGEPVPFLPYRVPDNYQGQLLKLYHHTLDQTGLLEKAVIPVEKTNGPILMFTGRDDTLWPATRMADMVMARLEAKNFPYEYRHFAYDHAGHQISRLASENSRKHGGTKEGNRVAQGDSEARILDFLYGLFLTDSSNE